MVPYIAVSVLGLLCAALLVKLYVMKKDISELSSGFTQKLSEETNTLLTVSSGDKTLRGLAASMNAGLRELNEKRRRYVSGDAELKKAVTNVSHDLRTPLTAVSGYLQLMENEEMSDKAREYLGIVSGRTQSMKELTAELFRYSVVTSPEKEMNITQVNVSRTLFTCLAENYVLLSGAGIAPVIDVEENIIRAADEAALMRVFHNILSNAAKYSDGDLTVKADKSGRISFINGASALSRVEAGRLFDRFYTVNEGRTSTGLGLSIARTLVERMGGTIGAEYEDGRLTVILQLKER